MYKVKHRSFTKYVEEISLHLHTISLLINTEISFLSDGQISDVDLKKPKFTSYVKKTVITTSLNFYCIILCPAGFI
jgi:hypothetical protein